jgi:hypothetical protein
MIYVDLARIEANKDIVATFARGHSLILLVLQLTTARNPLKNGFFMPSA